MYKLGKAREVIGSVKTAVVYAAKKTWEVYNAPTRAGKVIRIGTFPAYIVLQVGAGNASALGEMVPDAGDATNQIYQAVASALASGETTETVTTIGDAASSAIQMPANTPAVPSAEVPLVVAEPVQIAVQPDVPAVPIEIPIAVPPVPQIPEVPKPDEIIGTAQGIVSGQTAILPEVPSKDDVIQKVNQTISEQTTILPAEGSETNVYAESVQQKVPSKSVSPLPYPPTEATPTAPNGPSSSDPKIDGARNPDAAANQGIYADEAHGGAVWTMANAKSKLGELAYGIMVALGIGAGAPVVYLYAKERQDENQ